MSKRQREEQSIGKLLGDFVRSHRLEGGLDQVAAREAWHGVMGEAISKYTTDVRLEGGSLFVRLSSSVLREELSYGRSKIISLLNEELEKEVVQKLILQ